MRVNLVGDKFGRLTVISLFDRKRSGSRWLCKCECGNEHTVFTQNLKNGSVRSCGCQSHPTKHGMTNTRVYQTWAAMKSRCRSQSYHAHKHYAGKGVAVCNEWLQFEAFYEWALKNGYKDDLTLDRVDNSKGYEPSNCRFVTIADQQRNKTSNRIVTFQGKTKSICQFADDIGIARATLCNRLSRGWSVEKALTTPVKGQ